MKSEERWHRYFPYDTEPSCFRDTTGLPNEEE
jgi:hypothetical protein